MNKEEVREIIIENAERELRYEDNIKFASSLISLTLVYLVDSLINKHKD